MASSDQLQSIRDFLFRGLMFEAGATSLRRAGVRVGATPDPDEETRGEVLDSFPISVRTDALEMARLYSILYCLENAARQFIEGRLQESIGEDWWDKGVQSGIRQTAESRRKEALENPWLASDNDSMMSFVDFGGLSKIIVNNWAYFSDLIPSQSWLEQRFDEMERVRNAIAHNRLLSQDEFQRLYMYVRDWTRQTS